MRGRLKTRGFTLIELLVALAVFGIAAAITAPVLSEFRSNARMRSAANEIASAARQARSEAMLHEHNMQLQINVPPVLDAANPWGANGWRVRDMISNADKLQTLSKLAPVRVLSTPADAAFVFTMTGMVQRTAVAPAVVGAVTDVVFQVCDTSVNNEVGHDVVVTRFGRVFIRRHANATTCN